jgi:GNAT superfamily N-acetyltransferase
MIDAIARRAATVREATPTDADGIRDVAVAAWRVTYAVLIPPDAIERFLAQAYTLERVALRIERHDVLVATGDDADDGAAGPGKSDVLAFAECVPAADHVQLVALYARPDLRGRGLGSALLERVVARLDGQDLAADVLAGNTLGEPFYVARGFEPGDELVEEIAGEPIRERRWWLRAEA